MKKQLLTIATAIAFAFTAGALLADNGPLEGPESLGKINSTDGIILAQSSFDKMLGKKHKRGPGAHKAPKRPIRILNSYLSRTSSIRHTRRRDERVRPGERVYFYYKVGPLRVRQKAVPVKTRLVVRKNGRTVYNGSWRQRDARRIAQRNGTYRKGKWIRSYESSAWSYRVPTRQAKGRYSATIYFKDVNHGQTLQIRYNFVVKKKKRNIFGKDRDRGRYDRGRDGRRYDRDRNYGRTRYYNRGRSGRTKYYNRGRYGRTKYYNRGRSGRTKYYNRGRYGGTRYYGGTKYMGR